MQLCKLWELAPDVSPHQCDDAAAHVDVALLAFHWLRVSVNTIYLDSFKPH